MIVVAPRHNWVRQVRRFVQPAETRCELCRTAVPAEHAHLVDIEARRLRCACRSCIVTVGSGESGPYRTLPRRAYRLEGFRLTDAEWDALQIPIGMAFIFHSTPEGRPVALYPGPAGATQSLLGLASWSQLVTRNPVLASLKPDVEALLVDRTNDRRDYYRVPIDRCYALAGLIRKHWRGLSGGTEAWDAIGQFFARLRQTAEAPHAGQRNATPDVSPDWAHGRA